MTQKTDDIFRCPKCYRFSEECDCEEGIPMTPAPSQHPDKPRCLMNHHGDDGVLIEYLGSGKPCLGCEKRQECFEIFYAYRRGGSASMTLGSHVPLFAESKLHLWVRLPGKPNERVCSYNKDRWNLAVRHALNYDLCYGSGTAWIDYDTGRYWP